MTAFEDECQPTIPKCQVPSCSKQWVWVRIYHPTALPIMKIRLCNEHAIKYENNWSIEVSKKIDQIHDNYHAELYYYDKHKVVECRFCGWFCLPHDPFNFSDTPVGRQQADYAEITMSGKHPNPIKFYDAENLEECR